MKKIIQIASDVNMYSIGRLAEHIGKSAISRGWSSFITTDSRTCGQSQSEVIQIGSMIDIYWHVLMTRLFDSHGFHSTRATMRLINNINDINPDIIHLHHIHGYYINIKLLFDYLRESRKPVVWTFHDCWSFTGHCAHFVTADCFRWRAEGCHDCPLRGSYPKSFFDYSKRNFRLKKTIFTSVPNLHIVAVSDWLASFIKQSFFKNMDISVIKNGIDIDKFIPSECKKDDVFKILGVASLWNRDKGLYDFFRLRDMLPEDKYKIVLVGLTPKQLAELPSGINGMLKTSSVEELAKIYSSADVFVNPTYADSFPTVNIEALACGTPVVTYRTGGSPEIVDQHTGVVVDQGDIEGLASAVTSMKERQLSSEECRCRAIEKYDKDLTAEKYCNLYETLLRQ